MSDEASSERAANGVPGYEKEPLRAKRKLATEEYEYELPFNYENVKVNRHCYHGSEFHGMELNPINSINDPEHPENLPADSIEIQEPHPIIRIVVIGSACTPPGYIQIECEPIEEWRRPAELATVMPVRMRINGLWGMHLRWDQWYANGGEVEGVNCDAKGPYETMPRGLLDVYPALGKGCVKSHYREFPLAGMSSAVFEIPPSKKVIVMGGCEMPGWRTDNFPDDAHYSFRIIRTTVRLPEGG